MQFLWQNDSRMLNRKLVHIEKIQSNIFHHIKSEIKGLWQTKWSTTAFLGVLSDLFRSWWDCWPKATCRWRRRTYGSPCKLWWRAKSESQMRATSSCILWKEEERQWVTFTDLGSLLWRPSDCFLRAPLSGHRDLSCLEGGDCGLSFSPFLLHLREFSGSDRQAIMWTEEKVARAKRTKDSEEKDSRVLIPSVMITRTLCKANRASLGQVNKFNLSLHWREFR